MKKRLLPMSILLAGLLLGLSACGNNTAASGQDTPAPSETVAETQETETVGQEEETIENEEPDQAVQADAEQDDTVEANDAAADSTAGNADTAANDAAADTSAASAAEAADTSEAENNAPGGALVVYFSRVGNTEFPEDIDADSSASIRIDENGLIGNAGQIAAWIAEQAGCETMEIRTEDAYPVSYNETVDLAKQEQNEAFRPQLEPDEKSVEDYDTIYLVFPNWWGDLPMPVYSFLDSHDLTGKTVKVFVTHEGSSFSNTVGTIAELEPGAEVLEGLAVRGASVSDEEDNIKNWVTENQD